MAQIVRRLRAFARLDEAEFAQADISDAIENALTFVEHELGDIEIERELQPVPKITCFASQLNQVLVSMLMNASQAMDGRGRIQIRTRADDGDIEVAIADDGPGIPREDLDKIFDPGFTTRGVGVGTGLGLAISYRVVNAHGGRIDVKSELGQGTTFTIRLPISDTARRAAMRTSSQPGARPPSAS